MIQTILWDGETSFGPYTTCLCEIKGHNGTFRTLFKYKATFLVCKNLETFLRFKKNTLHKTFYYKEVIKIESWKIRAEIIQHKIENHIFCTERTVIINQERTNNEIH